MRSRFNNCEEISAVGDSSDNPVAFLYVVGDGTTDKAPLTEKVDDALVRRLRWKYLRRLFVNGRATGEERKYAHQCCNNVISRFHSSGLCVVVW